MLTRVSCTECQASFQAPAKMLGRLVKCPQCQKPFRLPEPPGAPSTPPTAATATPRRRPADEEVVPTREPVDDYDDRDARNARDGEAAPRRTKPVAQGSGFSPLLIAGIAGGALVLLVGVGLLVWALSGSAPSTTNTDLAQNTNLDRKSLDRFLEDMKPNPGAGDNQPPEPMPKEPPTTVPVLIKEPPVIEPPLRKKDLGKEPLVKNLPMNDPPTKEPATKEPPTKEPPRPMPKPEPELPLVPVLREEVVPKGTEALPRFAVHRFGSSAWRLPEFVDATPMPDGKEILLTESDKPPKFWDATTGKQTRQGPASLPSGSLSADGKYFLAQEILGKGFQVYELASGKKLRLLPFQPDLFAKPRFSRDGMLVSIPTSVNDKKAIVVVNLESGETLTTVPLTGTLSAHGISPDNKILAVQDQKGTVTLREIAGGAVKGTFPGEQQDGSSNLAFTENGKHLIVEMSMGVLVWDLEANKEHARYRVDGNIVAISVDGQHLALHKSVEREGRILLLNALTGDPIRTLANVVFDAPQASFSANGQILVVQEKLSVLGPTRCNNLRVWNVATGEENSHVHGHHGSVRTVQFTSDGKTLISTATHDQTRFWDLTNREKCQTLWSRGYRCEAQAVSPDGKTVVINGMEGKVAHEIGGALHPGSISGYGDGIRFSSDGKTLGWCKDARMGSTLTLFKSNDLSKATQTINVPTEANQLVFAPDGKSVAVGIPLGNSRLDPKVQLVNPATGAVGRVLRGFLVGFTPNSQPITSTSVSTLTWWGPDGKELRTSSVGDGVIQSVAIPVDGRMIAIGTYTDIVLLDRTGQRPLARLPGHLGSVTALAFSPDGKMLASGGQEGSVLLWDVAGVGR